MAGNGDVQFTSAGILVITGMLSALVTAIVFLFRTLLKAKDDHYAAVFGSITARNEAIQKERDIAYEELKKNRDALNSMAVSAVISFNEAARKYAEEKGIQVPKALAPVVPESNSPATDRQLEDARLATLGAGLTAAALVFNLSARPKPETGPEPAPIPPDSFRDLVAGTPSVHSDDLAVRAAAGAIRAIRENTESNREVTEANRENTAAIRDSAEGEAHP
jgi:hypothetical protein